MSHSARLAPVLAILGLGACAFVPTPNSRLDEARIALERASADPQVGLNGAVELANAAETLQLAITAHDTLDDPARVDHLAYLAKQRVAIAREAARLRVAANRGQPAAPTADPTCAGRKCRDDSLANERRITVFPGAQSTSR